MKQRLGIVVLFAASALALGACSGRGTSVKRVKYCSSKNTQKYIPLEDEKFESTTKLDPNSPFDPEEGDYKFNGAQIYYYDTERDIRAVVNVSRTVKKAGDKAKPNTFKNGNEEYIYDFSVDCFGGKGIKPGMAPLRMGLPIVTDFQKAGAMMLTSQLTVILGIGPHLERWREVKFEGDNNPTQGSPKDTYGNYPSNEAVFAKIKESNTHQIRARVVEELNGGANQVVTRDMRARVSYK